MKLSKLNFIKDQTNPLEFLNNFELCFDEDFPDEQKSTYLFKSLPVSDYCKFRDVWQKALSDQYEYFKSSFIEQYLSGWVNYRRSKLSIKYDDYSSVQKFVEDKLNVLCEFGGLEENQALENVVYEFPTNIAINLLKKGANKNKETLINLSKLIDLKIESGYEQLIGNNSNSASRLSRNLLSNLSLDDQQSTNNLPSVSYPTIIQYSNSNLVNTSITSASALSDNSMIIENNTNSAKSSTPLPKKPPNTTVAKRGRPPKTKPPIEDNSFQYTNASKIARK